MGIFSILEKALGTNPQLAGDKSSKPGFFASLTKAFTSGSTSQTFSNNNNNNSSSNQGGSNSSNNSATSSWGGSSSVSLDKHDSFFSKNNANLFQQATNWMHGAGAIVHDTVAHYVPQIETHIVEMPIIESYYIDPAFREFHPASEVADAGLAAGAVLDFFANISGGTNVSPTAVQADLPIEKGAMVAV